LKHEYNNNNNNNNDNNNNNNNMDIMISIFMVMKMDIISRGKLQRNPHFEIPRDEIFVLEEEQKQNQFKKASHALSQATIL